jgi:beta-barrel assembly-enhancing protease
MRFQPKAPKEAINYSRESLVREAAVLLLAAGVAAAVLFLILGEAVEFVAPRIPVRWEKSIFGGLARALDTDDAVAGDAALDDLVRRIASRWPDRSYEFHVAVVENDTPNAFALPGGGIAVTRGLLTQAESENELAFVLAHELGHFEKRDHLRGMGRATAFTLLSATIGAATGIGVPNGLALTQRLTQSGFNRAQESAADEFALDLVHREYGHLAGAFDFFGRDTAGGVGPMWLSTHPSSDDRIERLESLARQRGWSLEGAKRLPIRLNQ